MDTVIFDPFSLAFWMEVGVAAGCGAVIGLERQLRGKPAGIRTSMLICLGTYVFVHLGSSFVTDHADPTRVVGQVVTGVGFLGAGVIMARDGIVRGITSAAVIWMLAAIGTSIGLHKVPAGIAIMLTTLVILVGVDLLETFVKGLRRGVHAGEGDDESR